VALGNVDIALVRLTTAGTTLTIGAGITLRGGNSGHSAYVGSHLELPLLGAGPTDVSAINQRTIPPATTAAPIPASRPTLGDTALRTSAPVEPDTGGQWPLTPPLAINGSGLFGGPGSGTIAIAGYLTGDTRNADLFKPLGVVRLGGSGTPAAP